MLQDSLDGDQLIARLLPSLQKFSSCSCTRNRNLISSVVKVFYKTLSLTVAKVKLSLCLTKHHAMKTYWSSGGRAPRILHFGTRRKKMISFTLWPLHCRGKSPRHPPVRWLIGTAYRVHNFTVDLSKICVNIIT